MKKQATTLINMILILMLSGCASYEAQLHTLAPLAPVKPAKPTGSYLAFAYAIFTRQDCMYYLDRDVLGKDVQPVHLTIVNNTPRHLVLSLSSFSFTCLEHENVAHSLHTSTVKRAASYGVAALFIWPLFIPAIVEGIGSAEANNELDTDFYRKALKNQVINPFSTVNGLLFVPIRQFKEAFSFTLVDQESNEHFVLTTQQPFVIVKDAAL